MQNQNILLLAKKLSWYAEWSRIAIDAYMLKEIEIDIELKGARSRIERATVPWLWDLIHVLLMPSYKYNISETVRYM